jgi:hypothetical protein
MPARRFPPPWSVDEMNNACFIVRDKNGHALAYVYFESDPVAARLLTCLLATKRVASQPTSPNYRS